MTLSEASIDFIAGWASGAVAVLAVQPVDTVLTRQQAGRIVATTAATATTATTTTTTTTNAVNANVSIPSFWKGSSIMMSAVPLQNALLMGGYGVGKQYASEMNQQDTLKSVFVGGTTGGILQSFLMSPVEWIKVHQQTTTQSAQSRLMPTIRRFLARQGSTTQGLHATLWRDGIPHGVWFVSYEWSKTEFTKKYQNTLVADESQVGKNTFTEQAIIPMTAGAFAATVAWAVGYPFDIIKTRIQASSNPKGVYATGMELVREGNLYQGFGLKLLRAIPASMVGFLTYETVAQSIRRNGE